VLGGFLELFGRRKKQAELPVGKAAVGD